MAAVDQEELKSIFGDDGSIQFDEFNRNLNLEGRSQRNLGFSDKQQRLNTNLVQIPANLLKVTF